MANLTKTYIEKLAKPGSFEQRFEWDDSIKGFGVRLTSGSKTFILDRKLDGRTIRTTIGRFPEWSVPQAREQARALVVMMDKGIDPREAAKKRQEEGVTVGEVFEQFIEERQLKERTKADYRRYLEYYLSAWKDRPINRIDADMISKRYKDIGASSSGVSQASSVMRFLRSLMNYAQARYGAAVLPINPVASLTAKRAWIRESPKTDHLRPHEIKGFIEALRALPNAVIAAYLEFIVLTGARRSEAAQLKWRDVDVNGKTLTFRDTKNHQDRTIPITPRVAELVEAMKAWKLGDYVFGTLDKNGKPTHVIDPRKSLQIANKAAGSEVTVHGLRRTFATLLEALDCPAYPLKALLGHSLRGDVTSHHYTQIGVERLRPWAEKYEQHILRLVSDAAKADVIQLAPTARPISRRAK